MRMRDLESIGYTLNHTSVGWWVDGCCGYGVSGYHDSRYMAVREANCKRTYAIAYGRRPSWIFPWECQP